MIAGVVKDLVQVVLVKATGAAKVSGTIYVVARLELDGDADDGKYWCSTHSAWEASPHAFPTATYELGGAWAYQRPAGMTTSKVSATKPARIWSRMTDNASAPESETACSSELEEMIYSNACAEAATGAAESVTGNVGGNVNGNVVGSIGSVGNNGITSGSFASNAITSDALATSAGTEIAAAVLGDTSSYGEGSKGTAIDNASATVNDIDGRIPAALVGNRMDASVGAFPLVIDGTMDGASVLKELLAESTGVVVKTDNTLVYKDRAGATLFTITIATGGRTRA